MKIELNCSKCGSNRFNFPLVLKDDAVITCADCFWEIGTVAALQRMVLEQLERHKPDEGDF